MKRSVSKPSEVARGSFSLIAFSIWPNGEWTIRQISRKATKKIAETKTYIAHVVGQVDEAEQLAARHGLDSVLAAGERRLQIEEEHHLRQRQRDHREIDPLAADCEQTR